MNLRRIIPILIALFLVSPVLIILFKVKGFSFPPSGEFLTVLIFTCNQATLSVLVSLIVGVLGALGLLKYRRHKYYSLFEVFVLLPNIFPVLLVILASINFFNQIGGFPFGLWGIVLIHIILNGGLISVALVRLFDEKVGGMAELALIEGASRWKFLYQALIYLRKDLGLLVLLVFGICFSSFGIPLIVGGISGTTIEVLIYEKISVLGDWSQAFALSVFQVGILFLFSLILSKQRTSYRVRKANLEILESKALVFFPLLLSLVVIIGPLIGLGVGIQQLAQASHLKESLFHAALYSLVLGLDVGILVIFFLLLIAYASPHKNLQRFMVGYAAPSSVITGFAFLIIDDAAGMSQFLRLALGITLISLPLCYRTLGEAVVSSLRQQVGVARTMGATWSLIFCKIVFPQVIKPFCFLGGLAAFWACGDFAFSGIVAGSDVTMALIIKSLLSSYRMELGSILVWLMVFIGVICFAIFGGIGRVLDRKSL